MRIEPGEVSLLRSRSAPRPQFFVRRIEQAHIIRHDHADRTVPGTKRFERRTEYAVLRTSAWPVFLNARLVVA